MMSLASRRQARALALQILYAADGGGDPGDVASAVAAWPDDFELEIDDEGRALAQKLAGAAVEGGAAIDERIATASRNWRLERMGRVDRNILRLAVGELTATPETPVKVVINEAVELAKRFGTGDSAAFVNGLLDRIAAAFGRDREREAAAPDDGGGREPG
ncbi:MAG TPA: transcription antitermination factor NusB [Kofleriaceae bacterium]|nr:transcription antitermination factor NusB [Kofleriaceae bacterium]